jgi:hypothetical protein
MLKLALETYYMNRSGTCSCNPLTLGTLCVLVTISKLFMPSTTDTVSTHIINERPLHARQCLPL